MAQFLKAVENNTAPAYQITVIRPDATVVDLTSTTVTMKLYKSGVQTNTASGHDACTLVTAASGIMSWQPKSGDLPSKGVYKGDVTVTYGDATHETIFDNVRIKVRKLLSST